MYILSETVLEIHCCCIFREDPQSRLAKTAVASSPYKTPEEPLPAQEERVEPQEEEPPRKNKILKDSDLLRKQRIGNACQARNESFAD